MKKTGVGAGLRGTSFRHRLRGYSRTWRGFEPLENRYLFALFSVNTQLDRTLERPFKVLHLLDHAASNCHTCKES
jgi:hypothetical protein